MSAICGVCGMVVPCPCAIGARSYATQYPASVLRPDPRDAEIARLRADLDVAESRKAEAFQRMRDEREHYRQIALVDQPATIARLTAERDESIAILRAASEQAHHEGTRTTGLVELAREVAAGVSALDKEAAMLDGWAYTAMRAARAWKRLARRVKAERDALRADLDGYIAGARAEAHAGDEARAEVRAIKSGIAQLAVQIDALALAAMVLDPALRESYRIAVADCYAACRATLARLDSDSERRGAEAFVGEGCRLCGDDEKAGRP